jgi:MATE family multidrug resistance protein
VGEGADWAGAGWTAIRLGSAWGLVSSTLLVVLGVPLSASFLPGDPAAVALAASLIPLAAAFQVFDAAQVVSFGVLRGAGDTQVPSVANIVGYYAIGLPLGAWLAAGLVVGLVGVSALLLLRVAQIQRRGAARVRA